MAIRFENLAPVLTLSSHAKQPRPPDHFVEFYEKDEDLVDSIVRFVSGGLEDGAAVVLVMTKSHRQQVEQRLASVDTGLANEIPSIIWADASEALEIFMRGEFIDRDSFKAHFGDLIRSAGATGRTVRVFGEMVAVLWESGNSAAALQLEDLWNELSKTVDFRLFCAYPTVMFNGTNLGPIRSVCERHTHLLAGVEAKI